MTAKSGRCRRTRCRTCAESPECVRPHCLPTSIRQSVGCRQLMRVSVPGGVLYYTEMWVLIITWVLIAYGISRTNFIYIYIYVCRCNVSLLFMNSVENKMWMSSTLKMILPIVMLILSAILGLVQGWGINHGHAGTGPKCEKLSVSFCWGLRYNLTAMPNFMGHEDQRQAERGVCYNFNS